MKKNEQSNITRKELNITSACQRCLYQALPITVIIQHMLQFFIIRLGKNTRDDFEGLNKVVELRIVFMNEQGIEDIGAAGTDNATELYNAAIVVFFEPVIEFVETGFLPVVAVIADVHHRIFFFTKKHFKNACYSSSDTLVKAFLK